MSQDQSSVTSANPQAMVLGQPAGLYMLFFAEMWERFSFYGLRALLILYLTKGFLSYGDSNAYTIYGAYLALVYMTPFFGGMLADRLMGAKRAVVFGGLLMACGQGFMMIKNDYCLFTGLALLIAGGGYFKPNISKIVGTLYEHCPTKRDTGFTIFYMGINLGAAVAPLICGYVGETMDWSYGFGLAGIGMLLGLGVFLLRPWMAQVIIAGAVGASVIGLTWVAYIRGDMITIAVTVFLVVTLLVSAGIAILAISRGGLPPGAGDPVEPERLKRRVAGLPIMWVVYLLSILSVPVFMLLVSGAAPLQDDKAPTVLVSKDKLETMAESDNAATRAAGVALKQVSTPAGVFLSISAILAFGYLVFETFRLDTIPRHRMIVLLTLVCISVVFWAFFEQAGSSMTTFADRNVNRMVNTDSFTPVTADEVGKTIMIQPTQEQVGFHNGDELFTPSMLSDLRDAHKKKLDAEEKKAKESGQKLSPEEEEKQKTFTIPWKVAPDNVPSENHEGMLLATRSDEIPTSTFQSANPIYILLLGLPVAALWSWLNTRKIEPSIPTKFSMAFVLLGAGFVALWYGAQTADVRGMVAVGWLLLAYLLHTAGELCLSPVGLSMAVKLSPARLVSTVIGAWFLSTAVGRFVMAIISQFTNADIKGQIPPPTETVHIYGNVFGWIAVASAVAAVLSFCLVPLLKRWMHEGED
ncbi:MAG: MFS transporter [Pirellulales bacterium]|nr:MFS transporter [Pirellulales bacterium]